MATVSANESESVLRSVLDQLLSSRSLRLVPVTPLRVAVLEINRYLLPPTAPPRVSTDSYSYDVTITDGQCRVKCYLAPGLNRLVQTNSVRCGGSVLITHLCVLHDERRLHHSCVCVEQLQPEPDDPGLLPTIKDLQSVQWYSRDGILQTEGPLQNSRKHYLALWNNEDPHGGVWTRSTAQTDTLIDVSKISLLRDLEDFMGSSRRPLPVLVRVLHRSRLRYYGKPGQNIDFPYQAYFEVADQSGVMSMVLWNDLCPDWYHSLTVGSVLYLQHYTLKRSYQNRSRPQLGPLSLYSFRSVEICLNPRNPSAVVTVVPPKSVHPQWSLPEVTYDFFTRFEIESLANNKACDIIGLVTYVGRVERVRNKGSTVPEKFWTYRWVHAIDGTTESPLILEIFASSQPEIFNSISPMTYLVCTQMRVCWEAGSSVYLTSSAETQVFVTGCHRKQPYVSEPKVKAFIQWTKTLKDSTVLRKTVIGGYYCYPPAPPRFTPSATPNNGASEAATAATTLALTPVADLQRELESMQYREHRRVAVQGHISAVQYHRWPPEAPHIAQQLDPDSVTVSRGPVPSVSPGITEQRAISAPSHDVPSPKRRRLEQHDTAGQRQYRTRAKAQSERQAKPADLQEEEEEDDEDRRSEEEPQTENGGSESDSERRRPPRRPVASWESGVWALQRQDVTVHVGCSALDRESVAEKFRFDERDVQLHRINLGPAQWSPDLPLEGPEGQRSMDFHGYFTLTILGLNQQAAVDALFLPVFSPSDPRAVGAPHHLGDTTLLSCLSSGCVRAQADFSPEALLSSAPALERDKVVCVLDACLLGENRLEIVCSKVYRAADVAPV